MTIKRSMTRSMLSRIALEILRRRQNLKRLGALGRPTFVSRTAEFTFHERISIGRYCRIGPYAHLDGEGGLTIADGVILAPRVTVLTGSHNYDQAKLLPYDDSDRFGAVRIGSGVWVGFGAIIMPGVQVGDGAIVGAGSVVTNSLDTGEIVAGNPAKVISRRNIEKEEIGRLVKEERFYLRAVDDSQALRDSRTLSSLEMIR